MPFVLLLAAGAFSGSLAWQQLLAVAGSLLRGRLSPRIQLITRLLGALMILGFAVRIALQALSGS
jgi:arginine exporter protein ArgO